MIKQLTSQEIQEYVKSESKKVLLDVRTAEEWEMEGKPDGEKLGLKTFFLTLKDDKFIDDFENLDITKDYEILTMCKAGMRSQIVSEMLEKNDYNSVNISDGFDGWLSSNLPCFDK